MAEQKNVDFYISSLSGGGAEHVLINLATAFSKMGNQVSITSLERRKQFYQIDDDIEVIRYDHTKDNVVLGIIKDILCVRRQLKNRKNTDVAVSFLGRTNIVLSIASIRIKQKIVICDRNNLARKYSKWVFFLLCAIYSLADELIVQTNEIIDVYPKFLRQKIKVLENPLDFKEMDKQCNVEVEKSNTLISVGRLERQKDYKTLISAYAKIANKHKEWNVKRYGKGDLREDIQKWIDQAGMTDRISLCGMTHTPFLEMKKAKVFVLSSFFEGFPNVLCEAMYAGLPCIATACKSGPRDLIQNGENGLLVEVGNVDEMAEKMDLLMSNQTMRNSLGTEAHKRILRLDSKIVCKRWLDTLVE